MISLRIITIHPPFPLLLTHTWTPRNETLTQPRLRKANRGKTTAVIHTKLRSKQTKQSGEKLWCSGRYRGRLLNSWHSEGIRARHAVIQVRNSSDKAFVSLHVMPCVVFWWNLWTYIFFVQKYRLIYVFSVSVSLRQNIVLSDGLFEVLSFTGQELSGCLNSMWLVVLLVVGSSLPACLASCTYLHDW